MSQSAEPMTDHPEREALSRLEKAVGQLLDERESLRNRVADLESLLTDSKKGGANSAQLQERLSEVESENRGLRTRIDEGRDGIDRLLSRLQFLEDQR